MRSKRTVCARCVRLHDAPPLARLWHALWRHGYRRFVNVLLDVNAATDPARFFAVVLAAGAVLAVLAYAVVGSIIHTVVELFT